jgi:Spy/CpxP family protein refolding chaperone
MNPRHIPFVHPRVIEVSREGRVVSISVGGACAPEEARPGRGPGSGCGPDPAYGRRPGYEPGPDVFAMDPEGGPGFGAEGFGVKRPLRFLAFKLDLDDAQVAALAAILDELKTERAQAAVDDRRVMTAFADAISGEAFDGAKAAESAAQRKKSADRLGDAVVKALGRIHRLLTPEQRERFAYLIRTGTVRL